jgi:membrane protein
MANSYVNEAYHSTARRYQTGSQQKGGRGPGVTRPPTISGQHRNWQENRESILAQAEVAGEEIRPRRSRPCGNGVSGVVGAREMKKAKASTANDFKSLWKLGGLGPWRLTCDVAGEIRANDSFGRASELAFDFLFALFPLILFMLTLFGLFASRSVELQNDFLSYFAELVPPIVFELLKKTAAELAANAGGGKLTFGIVVALWFGSGGVSSMMSSLNLAYRAREARSWFERRVVAFGLTFAISILVLAALFIVLVSGQFVDWLGAELNLQPITVALSKAFEWPAALFFVILSYSLIYFYGRVRKERRPWHWLTPGSVFGGFVWLLSSVGFRMYIHFFNSYGVLYGSLGAVMILLAWLYLAGLAFLIGAEINARIERAVSDARCRAEPAVGLATGA